MKYITTVIFLLFLFSNLSYSKVNDTYLCTTSSHFNYLNGKIENLKNQKFTFVRNGKNLKFGSTEGFHKNNVLNYKHYDNGKSESFDYYGGKTTFSYNNGKFISSHVGMFGIRVLEGFCSIF